ncbi:MAG: DUF2267 domain-containing protein [Chitinivibrionales bacterium]|nr:DUF2267 domain-containing protein [Chitinivibrionales bacterium]
MDYEMLRRRVEELPFIPDSQTAEVAIKSVLGHLASRMEEDQARVMTASFPPSLNYDTLRSHQQTVTTISVVQFIEDIREQFGFSTGDTHNLIRTIMHSAKGDFSPDTLQEWEKHLPEDWAEMVEEA